MTDRIAIKHEGTTWYTTGTLEDVCARLNAGEPIDVWGFNQNGDRWDERVVLYGPPEFVVTDSP